MQLVFFDGERRGQPDDVAVGGLGQQTVVPKPQAHLPSVIIWRVRRKKKYIRVNVQCNKLKCKKKEGFVPNVTYKPETNH